MLYGEVYNDNTQHNGKYKYKYHSLSLLEYADVYNSIYNGIV